MVKECGKTDRQSGWRSQMKVRSMTVALVVALLVALPVYAQIGQGSIRGKVLDREGKPLPGATVRVQHLTTNQTDDVKTNRNGDYSITGLFQGQYKVSVIIDNRIVMVRGEGVGNAVYVSNGTDSSASFDLRNAPATPTNSLPVAAGTPAAPPPKDDKEREAQKKAIEEVKNAFAAGIAAMNAKNFDEAVKQLQLAAEKDPGQPAIFGNLGMALANLKKYDDAVAAYRKAIELKPDDPAMHALVSLAFANAGKTDEATKAVEEVVKLSPAMAGMSYYNLGAILTNRGRTKEAVEAFNKAITVDGKNAESYYQLGIAYFGAPDTIPQAIQALEKYLEIQPTGPNAEAAKGLIEAGKAQVSTTYKAPQPEKQQKGKTKN